MNLQKLIVKGSLLKVVLISCFLFAPNYSSAAILYTNTGNVGVRDAGLYKIDTITQEVKRLSETQNTSVVPEIQLTPDGESIVRYNWSYNISVYDISTGVTQSSVSNFLDETSSMTTGLEYVGNTLYGALTRIGTSYSQFATLDPFTGAYTVINTNTGVKIQGLSYYNNNLYAVGTDSRNGPSSLFSVDITTGNTNLLSDITLDGVTATGITALTIADGTAYALSARRSNIRTNGANVNDLLSIDLATGELTRLFTLPTVSFGFASLTSAPTTAVNIPSTIALFALAGLYLLRLRKKQM